MSGGAKGGKEITVGYWYRLGVQMALCHAGVDSITQMAFGEKTAWVGKVTENSDVIIDKKELFGGEKREGGVGGRVGVCFGRLDQEVDRYIKSKRGDTSAQRGIFSLVFGDSSSLDRSNLGAINFRMSTISPSVESNHNLQPAGILTEVDADMTRSQCETYISNFYDFPVNQYDDNGQVDALGELENLYGSWRAVAFVYAYRYFVLGQLPNKKGVGGRGSYSVGEFFNHIQRENVHGSSKDGSQPFYWAAMNPYFKKAWFRVQSIFNGWTINGGKCWYEEKAGIKGSDHTTDSNEKLEVWDMNPAHIIYNVLTNTEWGMGYSAADIDDDSFKKAADALYDEKFGLSIAWRREEVIEEFINIILKTVDAYLRINVLTGKFELILIRADENIDNLPILDEDHIINLEKYDRAAWGNTPNELILTYRDRNEESVTVTVQNLAAIDIQSGVISTTAEYVAIHEPELAARVAQRDLLMATTPLAKVTMTVTRIAFLLQVGDRFMFRWANLGITSIVMRVTSINKGLYEDGEITIEAVEDIFAMPTTTYVRSQGVAWSPPVQKSDPVRFARVWETPYIDVLRTVGEDNVETAQYANYTYARLLAEPTNTSTDVFDLYSKTGRAVFKEVNSAVSYAKTATLALPVSQDDGTIFVDGFDQLKDVDVENGYLVVGDEIMIILGFESGRAAINVSRGGFDTVPANHQIGTKVWYTGYTTALDPTKRVLGETVDFKPKPRDNGSTLDEQSTWTHTFTGRQQRPLPINGFTVQNSSNLKRSQTLNYTYNTRNRKIGVVSTWGGQSVAPEEGAKTVISWYDNTTGELLRKLDDSVDSITPNNMQSISPKARASLFSFPTTNGLILFQDFKTVNGGGMPMTVGSGVTKFKNRDSKAVQTDVSIIEQLQRTGAVEDKSAFGGVHSRNGSIIATYFAELPYQNGVNNDSITVGIRYLFVSGAGALYTLGDDSNTRFRITHEGGWLYIAVGKSKLPPYQASLRMEFMPNGSKFDNTWVDLLVTFDSANGKVTARLNDEKFEKKLSWGAGSAIMKNTVQTNNSGYIGYDSTYSGELNNTTKIDFIFIYNRALSDAEGNALMNEMRKAQWPTQVRVEVYTERDGLKNHQSYQRLLNFS